MRFMLPLIAVLGCTALSSAQDLYDIDKIRTIEITAPTNWRAVMAGNYASRTLIKVQVKVDNIVYKDVGARHRGFSTYRFLPNGKTDKRPWKLSFDEHVAGQKVQGYRTLNLNNNIWDPSMMREVAGYEFMRRFVRAPKCCFVKVKVNNEDLGLFTNTQQINKDFLDEHYRDDDGNRYRGERASSSTSWNDTALTWLGPTLSRYQAAYELKTENGAYGPWTKLINTVNVLNNTATAQLSTELPKVLDTDNALRFIAVANMTAWLDSYLGRTCKNFYLYEDPFHGRMTLQPWDLNNGFGGLTDGLGINGIAKIPVFYREFDSRYPRPLVSQMMKVGKWRATYLAHMRAMLEEFDWTKMGKRIDELRKFIRPALLADTKRIYTMQQFDDNLTKAINVGFVTTPGLEPFFKDRFAYLSADSNMARTAPTLSALTHRPTSPLPTEDVWVNTTISGVKATQATLYYRVRGPFVEAPMFDDGKHADGAANDGVWGAAIPKQPGLGIVEYYVSANNDLATSTGAMALLPMTGSYRPHSFRVLGTKPQGPIIISEILAKNNTGAQDEANEYEDWIELTNIGTATVSVSGMYLTDKPSNPTKWKIPTGQSIAPGGSLLIWADEDGTQGPLHANFKLSASGEEIALFAADGKTNIDWFEFPPQIADVSIGRLPDYLDFEVTFALPTPKAPNEVLPCGFTEYRGGDPLSPAFVLVGQGNPKLAATIDYVVSKAPASTVGALFVGLPASLDLPGLGTLLLDPFVIFPLQTFSTSATGTGKVSLKIPNTQSLVGKRFYMQSLAIIGTKFGLSNGVATRVCQ